MKNSMLKFLPLGFLLIVLTFAAAGQSRKPVSKIIEPTAKEAIKTLFNNGNFPLASSKNCREIITATKDRTIFDYLSEALSYQALEESATFLMFTAAPEKDAKGATLWIVKMMFVTKTPEKANELDNEDSGLGFKFALRNSDQKMILSSLECLAAG